VPTLKSLDTEGRVIHLGSFSKIVAPGLRLGWMVASEGLVDQLGLLKLAADTQTSTLNMAATSAYLRDYDIEAHIADVIEVYRDKRDVLLDVLSAELPEGASFTAPSGGLFVWLTLPDGFDADTFLKTVALPQERVAFVPGGPFFPTSQRPHHARLGFSGVPMDQLAEGATRLSRAMRVALSGR
jgi:2-aminoadipate transaminase